jgi:hypothetical protein
MPVFRSRLSQTTLTWILTILSCAALLPALLMPFSAQAELRAFQLKITDPATGRERHVITRFDHIQYPMYNRVSQSEVVAIEKTWMCYERSDFLGALCAAPADSPATSTSGGPGLTDRSPAATAPAKR